MAAVRGGLGSSMHSRRGIMQDETRMQRQSLRNIFSSSHRENEEPDNSRRMGKRSSNFGFPANPMETVKRASTFMKGKSTNKNKQPGPQTVKRASTFIAEAPMVGETKAIKLASRVAKEKPSKKSSKSKLQQRKHGPSDWETDDIFAENSFDGSMGEGSEEDFEDEESQESYNGQDDFLMPVQSERDEMMERSNLRSLVNKRTTSAISPRKVTPLRRAPSRFDSYAPPAPLHAATSVKKKKPIRGNFQDSMIGFGGWEDGPINLGGAHAERLDEVEEESEEFEEESTEEPEMTETSRRDTNDEVNSNGSINIFNFDEEDYDDDSHSSSSYSGRDVGGGSLDDFKFLEGSFEDGSYSSASESKASMSVRSKESMVSRRSKSSSARSRRKAKRKPSRTERSMNDLSVASERQPSFAEASHSEDLSPVSQRPTVKSEGSLANLKRIGGFHRRSVSAAGGDDFSEAIFTVRSEAIRNQYETGDDDHDREGDGKEDDGESDEADSDEENQERWKRQMMILERTRITQEIAKASVLSFEISGRKPRTLVNRRAIIRWRRETRANRRREPKMEEEKMFSDMDSVFLKPMNFSENIYGRSERNSGREKEFHGSFSVKDGGQQFAQTYFDTFVKDDAWEHDMRKMFATRPEVHRRNYFNRAEF